MSTQDDFSTGSFLKIPGAVESLITTLVTPELYVRNPFRVLGVSTLASTKAIASQVQKLGVLAEIGGVDSSLVGPFPITPPPAIDDIRKAERQLHDPVQRIIAELFWFWPLDGSDGENDPAWKALWSGDSGRANSIWRDATKHREKRAAATHNMAVLSHMVALGIERRTKGQFIDTEAKERCDRYWDQALRCWDTALSYDSMWETMSARVIALDDPRLSLETIQSLRQITGEAILGIHRQCAVRAASDGQFAVATRHLQRITEKQYNGLNTRVVVASTESQLRASLRSGAEAIDRDVQDNPEAGADLARKLIAPIFDYLCLFQILERYTNDESYLGTMDDVVRRANLHAVAYFNATKDTSTFIALMVELKPWAYNEDLVELLEKNEATSRANLGQDIVGPFVDVLEGIVASNENPAALLERLSKQVLSRLGALSEELRAYEQIRDWLWDRIAMTLRGISVQFWNGTQDGENALRTIELAATYAVTDEVKQTIQASARDIGDLVAANKRAHSGKMLRWVVPLGALGTLWLVASLQNGTHTSSSNHSSPSGESPSSSSFSYDADSGSTSATTESGDRFSFPIRYSSEINAARSSAASANLDAEQAQKQLDQIRLQVEASQAEFHRLVSRHDSLGDQLSSERTSMNAGDPLAIESFNSRVEQYNVMHDRLQVMENQLQVDINDYNKRSADVQQKFDHANRLIDAYNNKLQKYGTPVE